jgi:uncharacterized protein YjeT (DUF2065 family)
MSSIARPRLQAMVRSAGFSRPGFRPAAILGGIFFIVLVVAPLVFLEGLLQVFFSNVWTLAYRQLCGLDPANLRLMQDVGRAHLEHDRIIDVQT